MEIKNYFAQNAQGDILPGAQVDVFFPGTLTHVPTLQNAEGGAKANPFFADTKGLIQFAAPDGFYDMKVTAGAASYVLRIQCVDLETKVSEAEAFSDAAEGFATQAETARDVAVSTYADLQNDTDPAKGAAIVGRGAVTVGSLAELASLPVDKNLSAALIAGGRSGTFYFDSSDLSSAVTDDTEKGVYVAPASDPTGVSGAWVRQYGQSVDTSPTVTDGWFGVGEGDDSAALVAALKYPSVNIISSALALSSPVVADTDVSINVTVPCTITCTFAPTSTPAILFNGRLEWNGEATTIDCNISAEHAIRCSTYLPKIYNVAAENSTGIAFIFGASASGSVITGSTGQGRGFLRNCSAVNCGTFCIARGTGNGSDTEFGLIDCKTDENTGATTNLFNLGSLGYGYVRSGSYKGVSATSPNMTQTRVCEYIGGVYEGLTRGPTAGEGVEIVNIVGGSSINCLFSGVSVDARVTADNTVPEISGAVDWTVVGTPTHGAFVQAGGIRVDLRQYGDGTAAVANNTVRLTDAKNVILGNISASGAGSSRLVFLGEGRAPDAGSSAKKSGEWNSDSSDTNPVVLSANSTLYEKGIRETSVSINLSYLDDTILVDASDGIVDINVPNGATVLTDSFGKKWKVVVTDSTNNVTVTRAGGGATAINGGGAYTLSAGANYRGFTIESVGGGNYVVY